MSNSNASEADVDNLPENFNTAVKMNALSISDDLEAESRNKIVATHKQADVDPRNAANSGNTTDLSDEVISKAVKQDAEGDAIAAGGSSQAAVFDDLSVSVPASEEKLNGKTTSDGAEAKSNIYQVKWIRFANKSVPIITQNENGPCPLLAIANCLTLRHQLKLPAGTDFILAEQLVQLVCELLLENIPRDLNEATRPNYEHNVEDAMIVLPKLTSGIDVNVRFTGVDQFEYTPECTVFDLLGIRLYHGWLVDPENLQEVSAMSNCTYNQLVERIIARKSASDEAAIVEASIAEEFLERTASQLTYHGLCELNRELADGQLCVFFRNNHFATLHKHQKELFQLVTDLGYLRESGIVWETLNNVEGDGEFVNADFKMYKKSSLAPMPRPNVTTEASTSQQFIDSDLQLALSLQQEQEAIAVAAAPGISQWTATANQQQLSDFELARQLQEEESRQANMRQGRHQQYQAATQDSRSARDAQHRQQPPQAPEKKTSCNIS